jgi:hypothetical protein
MFDFRQAPSLLRGLFTLGAFSLFGLPPAFAQDMQPLRYEIGAPVLTDVWVDPAAGDDSRDGATHDQALKTLDAAWQRIPQEVTLSGTGYRILLAPGEYAPESLPNYMEARHGTATYPVLIQAASGKGTAILRRDLNIFNCSYLYLVDFDIAPLPGGDTLHFEQCDHMLARGLRLNGGTYIPGGNNESIAHDNFKVNQCRYVYMEDCDVSGADDNAVDWVSVQYGHVVGNKIHNSQDWCIYAKGGSAYLRFEGNEIYGGGTGGLTLGQGTGFQFMVSPWIHYEAYDMKVINNVIHDTEGAGLGAQGGYNVLMAYNTLYRVGSRDHMIEFAYGLRSCDGVITDPREACGDYLQAGGWGTTVIDDGSNQARIPNKNVYFYSNVIYDPVGTPGPGQIFTVYGPFSGASQNGSNAPNPARTDDNLQIRGNVIWTGSPDTILGIEDSEQGCQPPNAACNETQLRAENAIHTVEPQLMNPSAGDFRPMLNGSLSSVATYAIPAFPGGDRPTRPVTPEGNLNNSVPRDRDGAVRSNPDAPGAYTAQSAPHFVVGDVNGDDRVSVQDANLALRAVVGLVSIKDSIRKLAADVNGDGHLDVRDVTQILRIVVGLIG